MAVLLFECSIIINNEFYNIACKIFKYIIFGATLAFIRIIRRCFMRSNLIHIEVLTLSFSLILTSSEMELVLRSI